MTEEKDKLNMWYELSQIKHGKKIILLEAAGFEPAT